MSAKESNLGCTNFASTCVVAIQGGGVYGLSLLGQLQGVYDALAQPIAFAGTSAGAIIAALCWAGYSPSEVRRRFEEMAARREFVGLLGNEDGEAVLSLETLLDVRRKAPMQGSFWQWICHLFSNRRILEEALAEISQVDLRR